MSSPEDLAEKFGELPDEVMVELQNMLRIYNIDAEDLFFKWEEYCLKMGEDIKLNLKNITTFKDDAREQFEIEMRAKSKSAQAPAARGVQRTAKNTGDVFNMYDLTLNRLSLDGLTPATPRSAAPSAAKRKIEKAGYETPLAERTSKLAVGSSPVGPGPGFRTPGAITSVPFRNRPDPGKVMEVYNPNIEIPELPLPGYPGYESRVLFSAVIKAKNFGYKPMYQKLVAGSQVLDDRIEEYAVAIQKEHNIPNEDFCNPCSKLPEEVVVVGRIVTDVMESQKRGNEASLLLEASRGDGEGGRVRLDLSALKGYAFYPGMTVALKAMNPTADKLLVKSVLTPPTYFGAGSKPSDMEEELRKLTAGNFNVFIAAGPYTTDDNLDFEGLTELVDRIVETEPDAVFLSGPFIDTEHPKVKLGDFPVDMNNFSGYVLEDLFKEKITSQLNRITKSMVLLVPSTRDAVSKHVSFPQDRFQRKLLGLQSNVQLLTNPCMITLNEIQFGISSADILFHLNMQEVKASGKGIEMNTFHRLANYVISSSHFYPLFPAPEASQVGYTTPIDLQWMRLAEFPRNIKPDVLILSSKLPGTVKVRYPGGYWQWMFC
ncbi:DNA-directed DNA polymerase alpha subunit pol12 [Orbilia oligospora]|uniref:DNA polymerase alpha subunit B n=1 Tax=Orbilia oligospora TaxID=2813651 RepID=A0A7C8QY82_ORBOL|nr:DNA-directed DNA polymerase alpha subunit pol12 [Orbilia oligospora]